MGELLTQRASVGSECSTMLPKHPDLLTDDEIRAWIQNLISNRTPESVFLDYKETQGLSSTKQKVEIVKDITSFANEEGGVLLYGIAEERNPEDLPIPKSPAGIGPIPDFASTLEDIYVESISPRLPEYRIRQVQWSQSPDKVIYLVWTPKSWDAPHMIYAHKENRYYRRGNFRAVPMQEHEVERLYRQRLGMRSAADEFLKTEDFGEIALELNYFLRIVLCPMMLLPRRLDVHSQQFYEWINGIGTPSGRPGEWVPFLDGFRFLSSAKGTTSYFEFRVFSNASVSLCIRLYHLLQSESGSDFLRIDRCVTAIEEYPLAYSLLFFRAAKIEGPLILDVLIQPTRGVKAKYNHPTTGFTVDGELAYPFEDLHFREETTVREIDGNREAILDRLRMRMAAAFGLWI